MLLKTKDKLGLRCQDSLASPQMQIAGSGTLALSPAIRTLDFPGQAMLDTEGADHWQML